MVGSTVGFFVGNFEGETGLFEGGDVVKAVGETEGDLVELADGDFEGSNVDGEALGLVVVEVAVTKIVKFPLLLP